MVGDTAPALPPLNIHAKPASDAVRKARRELFMAKHYRTPWRIFRQPSAPLPRGQSFLGWIAVDEIEVKLQAGSLVAAFLCIPAIFMQSSNSHALNLWGNALSIAIWLFFVVEATILLRIVPNNWEWVRTHKLEVFIIIGASPFLTLMGEKEMVFGITPLLIIPRFLKLLKFAKFMKIGKLLKSMKIIKKNESVPGWVDTLILFIVAIFVIGILGTIINKKSKSLVQGFTFWFDLAKEQFQIKSTNVLITIGVIAIAAVFLALSKRKKPSIS